ncbi:MAG: RHS repeat domain-containing protein, partial [Chloroflexota bacterium]
VNRGLPVLLKDSQREYVWGLGLAYSVSGSSIEVHHSDGLGSTRAVTDGSASVGSTYLTDDFGVSKLTRGANPARLQYTGAPRDAETGFMYLRARMYDPVVGRFLQRDTVRGRRHNPITLNQFSYVGNVPTVFRDPSGHAALAAAHAICDAQGWSCDDLTHDMALEVLNGNAVPVGPEELVQLPNGSAVSQLVIVGLAAPAGSTGYKSKAALRWAIGSAGAGMNWHHIVEQTKGNLANFGNQSVQSINNVIKLPEDVHRAISAFYSSKQGFTQGKTVREWLSTQSFEKQYEFGIDTLKRFGVKVD